MFKLIVFVYVLAFLSNVINGTTYITPTITTPSTNSTPINPTNYPPFTNTPEPVPTTTSRPPTIGPPLPPQICCGQNEVFLPRGTAPTCDSECKDLAKKCTTIFILPPSGCYCLPGYCRNHPHRRCVSIRSQKIHCHLRR